MARALLVWDVLLMAPLTPDELIARAEKYGDFEVAEWIRREVDTEAAREAERKSQPITTPGGVMYPGRRYNVRVTMRTHGYKEPRERLLRDLTPSWSGYANEAVLLYPSGKRALYLRWDSERILSVEEIE